MFNFLKKKPPSIEGYDWDLIDPGLWSKFPSLADTCHSYIHQRVDVMGIRNFLAYGMFAEHGMHDIKEIGEMEMSMFRNMERECYASVLYAELKAVNGFKKANPNYLNFPASWWGSLDANGIVSHWSSECAARILFRKDDLRTRIFGRSLEEIEKYLDSTLN